MRNLVMSTCVPCALAVLLVGGLAASVRAEYATGFEASEGFTGAPWPAGWTAKPAGVRVGTTWATGGSQSLEVGLQSTYQWSAMDYTLPVPVTPEPGVVTEVGVDIRISSFSAPGNYNSVGYGFFIVSDIDNYSAGAVSFDLQDWEMEYSRNTYDDFDIQTNDPQNWNQWFATNKYFTPGSSYRFATIMDWSAGTTTLRLTDLGGSVVHQSTVNSLPNGVASVRFGGPAVDSDTLPVYFDNFSIISTPEPSTMSLLMLGCLGVLTLRRRK